MILTAGCDPQINVFYIGAKILQLLKDRPYEINHMINFASKEFDISADHILLSIDWLFIIKAITIANNTIYINETR